MKIDALVYRRDGEFCILYACDGEAYDHADGYDDEYEAVMAARRNVYGIGTIRSAAPWEVM